MAEQQANPVGNHSNGIEPSTGARAPDMTAWLDVLRKVLPARGVLLVGAGAGNGAWVRWLQSRGVASGDVSVFLVEGDEMQYRHLQRSLGAGTGCTPWRDVVAPGAGRTTFHRASNPAESGLLPPQALQQLWPNLGVGDDVTVEDATTLDALRAEVGKTINWLVLDCLPAAALLEGGANLLPQLDVAVVRVATDLPAELQAHQPAADELLQAAGLRRIYSQAERHPSLTHVLYVRDMERQVRGAQEVWAKEKAQLTQSVMAAGEAAEQAKLAAEQAQAKQLEAYQSSIKELDKQLRANLRKELENAVKQIEAFISIQSYLSNGDAISGFHGWRISPDLGLFLIERIRDRRYDAVIEFGSGTSTALFAKVFQINRRTAGKGETDMAKLKSICAFEHDLVYLRRTQDVLESQGLAGAVALRHAPLVDWQDDTGRYLYYDCDAALAALAKRLTGGAPRRVLVLVDGPPGGTCANARYPAVPHIFKHLARHEIDLVLDDASRPEETAVIELWRSFWQQRGIHTTETSASSEKGLYWARNYE